MIKVGCCGWAIKGGMAAYFKHFNVIEIQSTFYRLPLLSTAESWRAAAPTGFEFAMKAWQAITHPVSSPTWKKAAVSKTRFDNPANVGSFRPTEENFRAWNDTKEVYKHLGASFCILQSPPSFRCTPENTSNICLFLEAVDREGMVIGWEPRGDWPKHSAAVRKICERFNLVHVVDPFRDETLTRQGPAYFRLHGIGRGEVNYSYRYSDSDLRRLLIKASGIHSEDRAVYVLFNNISMAADAARFKETVRHQFGEDQSHSEVRAKS